MADKHYAVLIGNGEFLEEERAQLSCLKCPVNDVEGMSELLRSPVHGPYEVTAVTDKNCDDILEAIDVTLDQAASNDLVLVYYSGHGCPDIDGKLYLAARNTRMKALRRSAISLDHVTESMRRSRAESVVLILDCCFSGAVEKSIRGKGTAQSIHHVLPAENSGSGTYILTASTSYQIAIEKAGDKHSLLTKHIIAGIRNGAADSNGDGVVSMDELRQYVQQKIKAEGPQKPDGWALKLQGGELAIARTGRDVRGERRNHCLPLVYKAALEHHVPLRTIRPILVLFEDGLGVPQQTLRAYNVFLDRLYHNRDNLQKFIEELHLVSDDLRRTDKSTDPTAWVQLRKERDAALKDLKRAQSEAELLEKRAAKDKEKAEREIQRLSNQLQEQLNAAEGRSNEDVPRMIKQIRAQKVELRELKQVKEQNERLRSDVNVLRGELQVLEKMRTSHVSSILQPYISKGILFEPAPNISLIQSALAVDSPQAPNTIFYSDHLEYREPKELEPREFLGSVGIGSIRSWGNRFGFLPTLPYKDLRELTLIPVRGGVSLSNGITIQSPLDPAKLIEILNALKALW